MGEAAVALARAAGYRNAGTVEFLLEGRGDDARFSFLEVNARLQVEHPVTEQILGVDLVRAQIAIAAGEPLPWTQERLQQRGHAIELRLYAEDPSRGNLPQAGSLLLYREPRAPGIRIDSGVVEGDEVSVHYDPLLAKIVAYGETRESARRRAVSALRDFPVLGIHTNAGLLLALLEHPRFIAGDIDTTLVDAERDALLTAMGGAPPPAAVAVAAVAQSDPAAGTGRDAAPDPWTTLRGWRGL
jgi:acetyl/propionyl-CoA carboxylase alpha subunit